MSPSVLLLFYLVVGGLTKTLIVTDVFIES